MSKARGGKLPETEPALGVGDLVKVTLPPNDVCAPQHDGMVGFIVFTDDEGGYHVVSRDNGLRTVADELTLLRSAHFISGRGYGKRSFLARLADSVKGRK